MYAYARSLCTRREEWQFFEVKLTKWQSKALCIETCSFCAFYTPIAIFRWKFFSLFRSCRCRETEGAREEKKLFRFFRRTILSNHLSSWCFYLPNRTNMAMANKAQKRRNECKKRSKLFYIDSILNNRLWPKSHDNYDYFDGWLFFFVVFCFACMLSVVVRRILECVRYTLHSSADGWLFFRCI